MIKNHFFELLFEIFSNSTRFLANETQFYNISAESKDSKLFKINSQNISNQLTPMDTWRHLGPTTADVERDGTLQTALATGRNNELTNIFDFSQSFHFVESFKVQLIESATRKSDCLWMTNDDLWKYFHSVKMSHEMSKWFRTKHRVQ